MAHTVHVTGERGEDTEYLPDTGDTDRDTDTDTNTDTDTDTNKESVPDLVMCW